MQNQLFRRSWILIFSFCLFCSLIFTSLPSYALVVKDVPNPRQQNGGWVTDMVDMLSPEAERQLNHMISELEKKNGTEIAVVTVPETKPSPTPKQFTTQLFNTWGIGKKGQDNGVLFLVSKGDRRTEIETGYGIESILPDAKVGNIIRKQVTPQFKQGKFEAGIVAGTEALIQELGGDIQSSRINFPTERPVYELIPILFLLVLLALVYFIYYVVEPFKSPGQKNPITYLSPSGITRRNLLKGKVHCEECSKKMDLLTVPELESHLTQAQKIAKLIGSTAFQAWQCPDCENKTQKNQIHLLIQEFKYKASLCTNCRELTVTTKSTEVTKPATQNSTGIRRKQNVCQCCNQVYTKDEIIPRLSPPKTSYSSRKSSSTSSTSSSRRSSSSSYSSSYTSSSSSSDFGGGDSGGGGAGGDW